MFKPLNGRILVSPEKEKSTESGIIIAAKEERPMTGTVIVGGSEVKEGDKILFSKFGYDEVTLNGDVYFVVAENTVLGIFNPVT